MQEQADVERLAQELISLGFTGAVARAAGAKAVSEEILDWGIVSAPTIFLPFDKVMLVTCADPDIKLAAWQQSDRILLAVYNGNEKAGKDIALQVDLDKLGLAPKLPWQEFIGVRDLEKGPSEPGASLDFYTRTLKVPGLQPHSRRLIGLRLY